MLRRYVFPYFFMDGIQKYSGKTIDFPGKFGLR